jgi:integrase
MATWKFIIRRNKVTTKGVTGINIRYSHGSAKFEIATGEKIEPLHWDTKKGKPKSKYPQWTYLEKQLDKIEQRIKKVILNAKSQEIEPTTTYIKEQYLAFKEETVEENKIHDFFTIYDEFREYITIENSKETIKKFNNLHKNLREFEKKRKTKISFDSIDLNFLDNLMRFFLKKNYADSTIHGRVRKFKQFMEWAKDRGYNKRNDYKKFTAKDSEKDIVYLTSKELKQLTTFDLNNEGESYNLVRDIFCFACYTGLRYSDIKTLRPEHIKSGEIVKRMVKTRRIETIPLIPNAQAILDKYPVEQGNSYLFRVFSNPIVNRYIKEIGEKVGINSTMTITKKQGGKAYEISEPKYKFISFHAARHTFIILSLEKGVRVEVVQKAVGHRDIKTTMKYVKLLGSVVKSEFLEGWAEDY